VEIDLRAVFAMSRVEKSLKSALGLCVHNTQERFENGAEKSQ
jgi:hypothetical protein